MPTQVVIPSKDPAYFQLTGKMEGEPIKVKGASNFLPSRETDARAIRELTMQVSEIVGSVISARALEDDELDVTLHPVQAIIGDHPNEIIQAILFGISQGMGRHFQGRQSSDLNRTLNHLTDSIKRIFPDAEQIQVSATHSKGTGLSTVYHIPSGSGYFVFYIVIYVDDGMNFHSSFTPLIAYVEGDRNEDQVA